MIHLAAMANGRHLPRWWFAILSVFVGAACGWGSKSRGARPTSASELDVIGEWDDPEGDFPRESGAADPLTAALSNPRAPTLAITNATILTATGQRIANGTLIAAGGAIEYVGAATHLPPSAQVIDARGRYLTPGLIDAHSHIGVYATPTAEAHADGNEISAPVTAYARAEYGYWPQDPAITRARAGGITTALILPGSANLIGGQGMTAVMRPGSTVEQVRFPGAPRTIKMACGENPKRVYGERGGPATRMAEYAQFRVNFQKAAEYQALWARYRRKRAHWLKVQARAHELDQRDAVRDGSAMRVKPELAPDPPPRDFNLEVLAAALRGDALVQIHCYRAAEMREMVAIAHEFGFHIRAFHHALEAYKIRDLLAREKIAIATWADWWGFKMEAFDGIPENAALFASAGGRALIHSDSPIGIQRLNQEAAKAMYSGRAVGIEISDDQALRWVTADPAWVLGIDRVTGTLEPKKRADLVLWSRHPFSVYALPDVVVQAGEVTYRREQGKQPTDFEVGNSALDGAQVKL
jgi:imidazolonepropionase-like amidohydrolase